MSDIQERMKNLEKVKYFEADELKLERWKNERLDIGFWVLILNRKFYFFGKEVAESLKFTNTRDAISKYVDDEDKTTLEEFLGPNYRVTLRKHFENRRETRRFEFFQNLRSKSKTINEEAFYSLCLKSTLPEIRPFQKWVCSIIRFIRLSDSYNTFPNVQNLSLGETPVEKIESTYSVVPEFVFENKAANSERKEMNKAFTKGKELSKDLEQSEKGSLGGVERDRRDKSRIRLLLKFYNSRENLQDENLKKELEEIVTNQKLLEIEFE